MMRSRQLAVMDIFLFGVLVVLLYIFVNRMGYMSGSTKVIDSQNTMIDSRKAKLVNKVRSHAAGFVADQSDDDLSEIDINDGNKVDETAADEKGAEQLDPQAHDEKIREEIDARLKNVGDMRSESCKQVGHDGQVPASIIVDFFDYQLMDLKVTVGSVLRFTPASLIREIIIVDDGSTMDYLIKESQVFVAGIPKAVLVRNENRQGRMMARNRGAKEADGHNLIFLDTSVIVSPGWIEPLVEHIQKEKSVLAVPHFDRVTDPISYEYARVTEGLTTGLSWSLAVRLQPDGVRVHVDETKPRDLPVVHGAAFAVTKIYWNQIGGYDIGLGDGGGEHLELSLRTWLCAAGTVHILPCSHVGVLNSMDPVRISAHANIHRITEVYMSSYKNLVKSFTEYDENTIADDKKTSAVQRVAEIRGMKCTHDMSWFVEKVAVDMFAPSRNATEFGLLKVGDRLCAHLGNDSALDLGSCRPASVHLRPRDMSFELITSGELRIGDRCIECMDNAYALARQCKGGGAYAKQLWTYKDGILKNRWSNFCLMHVTDPDPKRKAEHRQIAMAQPCELDTTKNKDFSKWTLVKL